MRDDQFLSQIFDSLFNRVDDDMDNNAYDNTVIQYFTSPHEKITMSAVLYSTLGGTSLSYSNTETTTLQSTMSAITGNPATFTWGGYDGSGVMHNAGWYWNFGGAWQ